MWKSAETEPFKYNFDHTAILPLSSKSQGSKYQHLQVLTTILLHISQKFNCRRTWSTSLYKEIEKNTTIKTLMPRIFFWLPCIHGTSVADGTHQTSTQPLLTFRHCPTTAERVLSQHWRNGYPVSVATAWFTHNLLWTASLPGVAYSQKRWKSLPTGLVMVLQLEGYRFLQSKCCALWFPSFWTP